MAYGTKYRLPFTNHLGEDYEIQMNLKDYIGDAIELMGSGTTMTSQSFGGDDDRFTPVSSRECTITTWIKQSQNIGIIDFTATEDDQWQVKVIRDPLQPPIFEGFLLVEDSSEPLLDRPYELVIRASDGLPLLKNVPLKRADGEIFDGYNSFTDYIGHILYYISPDIHFRVYFDIYHLSMDINECALEQCGVNARTFEKSETEFNDSYTCLEEIMKSLQCSCYYENGFWHIVSRRQYVKDYGFNWTEYNMVANAVTKVSSIQNDFHDAPVGKQKIMLFLNKDARVFFKVHSKSVKLTYNYEMPLELVCNQSFRTTTTIPSLSGVGFDAYVLDCWDYELIPPVPGFPTPTKPHYVKREYDDFNYEIDKYLVLQQEATSGFRSYALSSMFYIHAGDQISFSVEARSELALDVSTPSIYNAFLRGDDGSEWYIAEDGEWTESPDNFLTFRADAKFWDTPDTTAWLPYDLEPLHKIPVSGMIQVVLIQFSTNALFLVDVHFKNLRINYLPYIKNSYRPAAGDYNIYEQNGKINKTIDEVVTISDSPKRVIKGAIILSDGTLPTTEWFRTGFSESLRFTQIMALIKYTFNYRQFCKVEGTIKGLSLFNNLDENIPFGFLPQYSLADLAQPTTRYILTSISEINYLTGHWRGILVEVRLNEVATFDKYDFSYIF